MKKNNSFNMEFQAMNDLFSTEEDRADAKLERVNNIPLNELHAFKEHPFKVLDDSSMEQMMDSVKSNGVLVPAMARPDPDGGYELISGHRRYRACERLGLTTMPVIVRDLDDDAATVIMVDSNVQRENLLPSEKARAYKMKLDAIKHQGARTDLTSGQLVPKSSIHKVADDAGENYKQVRRYIHLTELCKDLLDMVDSKKISFTTAYELSFLKPDEQERLLIAMDQQDSFPSLQQAKRMKECSQESTLSLKMTSDILSGNDSRNPRKLVIPMERVEMFFPDDWPQTKMMVVIVQLLEQWHKSRNA